MTNPETRIASQALRLGCVVVFLFLVIAALTSCSSDTGGADPPSSAPTSIPTASSTATAVATPTLTPTSVPTPTPTIPPTPTTPPLSVTAEGLYAEREANATRFDRDYLGKWVQVTGIVGEVDSGEVRLVVDVEAFRLFSDLLVEYIALHDLSDDVQVMLNKGQEFTATCKVGAYTFGAMHLRDCVSESGGSSAPAPTPTPIGAATPDDAPLSVTAEGLYAEREANATRFDRDYLGKWVQVTGIVGEVDSGEVRLVVDVEAFRLFSDLLVEYIALHDLSDDVQVMLDKGQEFTATCKVGAYTFGAMHLRDCSR